MSAWGVSRAIRPGGEPMADSHPQFDVVNVREFPLPGAARLFEVALSDGAALRISTESDAGQLGFIPAGADEAIVEVRLTKAEASTIASLLSGVRIVLQSDDDSDTDTAEDAAASRTVTLRAGSPAIGRLLGDLDIPDPDHARVVAVIRDDTHRLLEDDPGRRTEEGDRLVVVGRPQALVRLVRYLGG